MNPNNSPVKKVNITNLSSYETGLFPHYFLDLQIKRDIKPIGSLFFKFPLLNFPLGFKMFNFRIDI